MKSFRALSVSQEMIFEKVSSLLFLSTTFSSRLTQFNNNLIRQFTSFNSQVAAIYFAEFSITLTVS